MIKYKCEEGDVKLTAVGDSVELSADVVMLVSIIYKKMNAKDSNMALDFLDNVAHGFEHVLKKEI